MWQYLVRGDSTQIASSTYTVSLDSLEFVYPFVYISYGSINDQYTACKYLSSTYSRMFDCPNGGFVSEYTVLNKGEVLSSTGVKATLFLFGSKHVVAGKSLIMSVLCMYLIAYSDLYMVSDLALDNEKGTLLIVTYDPLQNRNGCYITISIIPIHHSLTLRISIFSIIYIADTGGKWFEFIESVDIQERLLLGFHADQPKDRHLQAGFLFLWLHCWRCPW